MSNSGPSSVGPPASTSTERIVRARGAFASAWHSDRRPCIESYLGAVTAAERPTLLGDLLATELALRVAGGEEFSKEDYERRFPGDLGLIDSVFVDAAKPGGLTPGASRAGMTHPGAAGQIAKSGRTASETTGPLGTAVTDRASVAPAWAALGIPSIPGFEIRGELGRGGMGVVYAAREVHLNRLCTLKMIRAGRLAGAGKPIAFSPKPRPRPG